MFTVLFSRPIFAYQDAQFGWHGMAFRARAKHEFSTHQATVKKEHKKLASYKTCIKNVYSHAGIQCTFPSWNKHVMPLRSPPAAQARLFLNVSGQRASGNKTNTLLHTQHCTDE